MPSDKPKQLPPKDLSPAELWMQLTTVPRAFRLVDFPRKDADGNPVAQVAMVVLTQEESMAASLSTERFVRKLLKDNASLPSNGEPTQGYAALYEKRESMEILFRCAKKADDLTKGFFPGVEQIGQKLTTDEIGVLVWNYLRVQAEIGPITSTMSPAEVDVWVERLVKGGSAFPFDSLSLGAQSQLLMSMASRLYSSQKDRSSPGTQQESITSADFSGSDADAG